MAYSPLQTALQNKGSGYRPMGTQNQNFSDLLGPIQTEIGRTQSEGDTALSDFMQQRSGFRDQFMNDLMSQEESGLTASTPGIEDRLNSLGIAQSGAYPEALNRERERLLSSTILPELSAFDQNTFNTASQMPMNTLNRVQGLQSGSLGRSFGQQDIQNQQGFMSGLAGQARQTEQLKAMLGLLPALIGTGGLFGGMGGGGQGGGFLPGLGGAMGSIGGALGGLGGAIGGLFGDGGSSPGSDMGGFGVSMSNPTGWDPLAGIFGDMGGGGVLSGMGAGGTGGLGDMGGFGVLADNPTGWDPLQGLLGGGGYSPLV